MICRKIYTILLAILMVGTITVLPCGESIIVEVTTTTEELITTSGEITTEELITTSEEITTIEKTRNDEITSSNKWTGRRLNRVIGTVVGPSGKETFYNLNMSGVIRIMRNLGYTEEEFPYHVREDGVKMFGPYIMCAANLDLRPRGTIVETSLGTAIVCDTGQFALTNKKQLDIAVTW